MKKLIFLLLVMALGAGMVFAVASPEYPPGVISLETIVMAEYGVQQGVVTQSSDLAVAALGVARSPSIQAVMASNNFIAIRPHDGFVSEILAAYQSRTSPADYYLRL